MKANIGDRLIVEGARVGEARRICEIIALRHEDGSPPYVVRWLNDGHEGLYFPGSDSHVEAAPVAAPQQGG
ncbi:MAG TPA: DUF1918 domain-containing protein [Micromonosporaceae bacterium]|nr:DUF1918 domain-containing protein [Micromonosporaceae bacterium]